MTPSPSGGSVGTKSRRTPSVGVLNLQGAVREHARALADAGAEVHPVDWPKDLAGLDGLVIPGGESTAIGKLMVRVGMIEPIRERMEEGMGVFGSCAGMILLANNILDPAPDQPAIGGMNISVRRNAYGRQNESFETELNVDGLEPSLRAVFIRAPRVEQVGDEVEILAHHDGHPVLVQQGRRLAASFHAELTDDRRIHAMFVAMLKEE